jgi:AcrR family transcriptional regulator
MGLEARGPGRPRSERARQAVLAATIRLIETDGYGGVTIEAIAARAGVGKQTIYRWWSSRAEIALEALEEAFSSLEQAPDSGSLESDVRVFLRRTIAALGGVNAELLGAVIAETQLDRAFARIFRARFLTRQRMQLHELLERARARGEVMPSVSLDFLIDVVFGVLCYRVLLAAAEPDRRFAEELSDALLRLAG